MSTRSIGLSDELHAYLLKVGVREPMILSQLREETAALPESRMQISPEQGAFMALLVGLMSARSYLEVGTFTGYSSLAVAMAMPADGRLTCCDISREWTDVARRYWTEAGVAERVDLRIAPAIDSLDALLAEGAGGSYDFAFLDADKPTYPAYYERILELLRPGGLLAIDNVLWSGRVADPAVDDEDTMTLRSLNEQIVGDDRVQLAMVPIGDGLSLVRKLGT
ncbi:MAG: methyltransferase domain-containing protein [Chloroflexi bacterium]|nr:MAG: methyltransferase domain-containing protein [Chloroflexota bacterium]